MAYMYTKLAFLSQPDGNSYKGHMRLSFQISVEALQLNGVLANSLN